jgi:hypothetical protein
MSIKEFLRIALLALLLLAFQGTWALAGVTGNLSGRVILDDGSALAGARVTASSPGQTISTTTDTTGFFVFVSLIPDTYTVSATKDGYDPVAQPGVSVLADNTRKLNLVTRKSIKILGTVTTRASAALVKPGTVADVYSVDPNVASKVGALGGGGGADSAYSAIATVPGAYVPTGSAGWYQTVLIRGGDYDQVGYEFDGVPINRSFDNYPNSGASSLGQQELQVYTGAAPANAESQGLAGFINQVIKSGTYPGFAGVDAALGTPNLYNKINVEAGGATPDRLFSYYLGVGGYSYGARYYDSKDGVSLNSIWGAAFNGPGIGPNGYTFGSYVLGNTSTLQDRDSVVNLHFGIPHHNDAGKDDIQLLYDTYYLNNPFYGAAQDWGPALTAAAVNPFPNGWQYNGSIGQFLPAAGCASPCNVVAYSYPSSGLPAGSTIPINLRDTNQNGNGIGKFQYQHNIGSNAYVRLYAYTYYSWWFLWGPNGTQANFIGPTSSDYELTTHTRGASMTFADQITPQHLLNLEVSDILATTERSNNTQMLDSGTRERFAVRVDSNNPTNGICYDATSAPVTCSTNLAAADWLETETIFGGASVPAISGTCGTGPCKYYVVENGKRATFNTVKPNFTAAALTDQWKPSDKLLLNLGVRIDRFSFKGADTTGPARNFWFNAINQDACVLAAPGNTPVDKSLIGTGFPVTTTCGAISTATGQSWVSPGFQNASAPTFAYTSVQPRIGGTYTLDPDNVIRFNYGKYAQAPNAAFEQYNTLNQNLPEILLAPAFYKFGFKTPGHQVPPENSFNTDLSFEHHFANSDASFKLTPFLRKTQGQFQTFFLDQKTSFVSGLPAGSLTASGVELQIAKGDFNRNGLSGILSYAYTYARIKYFNLANGGTVLSPVNNSIKAYNAYTQFCATNPSDARCGGGLTSNGGLATPCFTSAGGPDPTCTSVGTVANPYWLAPVQPLLDEHASYPDYSLVPGGFNASVNSNDVPHVATLVLNLKHDAWSITPIIAFHSGNSYGSPLQTPGVDPALGCATLATSTSGDPRYPYGASGGAPYEWSSCGGQILIPDPFTHAFDTLGAFRAPSQIQGHLGITYEATPRITYAVNLVNIINTCFGGTSNASTPWTNQPNVSKSRVCSYNLPGYAPLPSVGNQFNPGDAIQQQVKYPYMPYFGVFNPNGGGASQTFGATFEVKLKL